MTLTTTLTTMDLRKYIHFNQSKDSHFNQDNVVDKENNNISRNNITDWHLNQIPPFMRHYIHWHGEQLRRLRSGELSWKPSVSSKGSNSISRNTQGEDYARFLILRCLKNDGCGGTSDRIRTFPLFLFMAAKTQRILLIRWGRPFPIETFMRPVSWNWTVPERLQTELDKMDSPKKNSTTSFNPNHRKVLRNLEWTKGKKQKYVQDNNIWILEGYFQYGGEEEYEKLIKMEVVQQMSNSKSSSTSIQSSAAFNTSLLTLSHSKYTNIYHHLFHASFRPSPPVRQLLRPYFYASTTATASPKNPRQKQPLLRPNTYTVIHYRARYPGEPYRLTGSPQVLVDTAINAIDCALRRSPLKLGDNSDGVAPLTSSGINNIYFASDTKLALDLVEQIFVGSGTTIGDGNGDSKQYRYQYENGTTVAVMINDISVNRTNVHIVVPHHDDDIAKPGTGAARASRKDPAHLNFAEVDDPSGLYATFVDLFVMSHARCVVYGSGEFGLFGSLASYNPDCGTYHSKVGKFYGCPEWKGTILNAPPPRPPLLEDSYLGDGKTTNNNTLVKQNRY